MPSKPQLDAYETSLRDAELSTDCFTELLALLPNRPKTFLDIGCGCGHLPVVAASMRIDSMGIDLCLPLADETKIFDGITARLIRADLTSALSVEPADLVVCWEVAEHLPESAADDFCKLLVRSTGEFLAFTAAVPGQGGMGHLNEQPKHYWREKLLASEELSYFPHLTKQVSERFLHVAPRAPWYGNNLQIFRRI